MKTVIEISVLEQYLDSLCEKNKSAYYVHPKLQTIDEVLTACHVSLIKSFLEKYKNS